MGHASDSRPPPNPRNLHRVVWYTVPDEFFLFDNATATAVFINDAQERRKLLETGVEVFDCNPVEHAGIEITRRCNLRCTHCWQGSERDQDLPIGTVEAALTRLQQLGLLTLRITGGEPLLHQHFWEVLDVAALFNLSIIVSSNGTLIGEEAARRLTQYPILFVELSLDGPDADTHDEFRGRSGTFAAVTAAIRLLGENGIRVHAKTVLHKGNVERLTCMAELLASQHPTLDLWALKDLIPLGRAAAAWPSIEPAPKTKFRGLAQLASWIQSQRRPLAIEGYSLQLVSAPQRAIAANFRLREPCAYKERYLYIDAGGVVRRCALLSQDLARATDDFTSAWERDCTFPAAQPVPQACGNCTHRLSGVCGYISYICPAVRCPEGRWHFLDEVMRKGKGRGTRAWAAEEQRPPGTGGPALPSLGG